VWDLGESRWAAQVRDIHRIHRNGGTFLDGPEPIADSQAPEGQALPTPPGDFVSADHQSDCARFLAELRRRADLTADVEWTLRGEED
jgi:hypothetical protein